MSNLWWSKFKTMIGFHRNVSSYLLETCIFILQFMNKIVLEKIDLNNY